MNNTPELSAEQSANQRVYFLMSLAFFGIPFGAFAVSAILTGNPFIAAGSYGGTMALEIAAIKFPPTERRIQAYFDNKRKQYLTEEQNIERLDLR